jgi:hypothetical protein
VSIYKLKRRLKALSLLSMSQNPMLMLFESSIYVFCLTQLVAALNPQLNIALDLRTGYHKPDTTNWIPQTLTRTGLRKYTDPHAVMFDHWSMIDMLQKKMAIPDADDA